jgi:hypothetical protein
MGRKPNNKIQLQKSCRFTGHSRMPRAENASGAVIRTSGLSSAFTPSIERVARNSSAETGSSLEQLKDGNWKSLGS